VESPYATFDLEGRFLGVVQKVGLPTMYGGPAAADLPTFCTTPRNRCRSDVAYGLTIGTKTIDLGG